MIILHLKNPYKVMKTVRKYISPDGRIIVKDIDDGLNIAFPDPDGDFERTYRICDEDELSGFRHSGRQIHSLLAKIGMNRIVLEKTGLNTIGMDFSERQALFDTYFSFIREDLAILHEKYPDDENITNNLHWYEDNYDDLEEQFHSREFMFSLGFMIYTASL